MSCICRCFLRNGSRFNNLSGKITYFQCYFQLIKGVDDLKSIASEIRIAKTCFINNKLGYENIELQSSGSPPLVSKFLSRSNDKISI